MKKQMYVAPKAEVIELSVNKDFMQKVPFGEGAGDQGYISGGSVLDEESQTFS